MLGLVKLPRIASEPAPSSVDRSTNSESAPVESFARELHRATELLRDGDPQAASMELERALRRAPDNAPARNLLARCFFQQGQLERALVLYEALLLDFGHSAAAKVNVAVTLLKLGRASAARPLLEDVVKADPSHKRAWGYLGVALEQLGLLGEAEGAFLAGHYASAATRLRERHPHQFPSSVPDVDERARTAMPAYRRKTLAPAHWGPQAANPQLATPKASRFAATLRPLDVVFEYRTESGLASVTTPPPPVEIPARSDVVEEIPFEQTTEVACAILPPSMSHAPTGNRPVVPLLDAALSSLLAVPHEATVVAHPTGLVLVGLVAGPNAHEGGFAARSDTLHAFAGPLEREPLPRRPSPAPEPFRSGAPFVRVSGSGQLVLAPPSGTRLLPVDMDADVAFLREDLVVAFDRALLCDLGRIRDERGDESLSLVRFRGDGVIVLALNQPFLAFDVHGESTVTLRADSLIGWIGLLAPEPLEHGDPHVDGNLITFSGEGTLLFRAPAQS